MNIIIFLFLCVTIAVLAHWRIKHYFKAAALAAAATAILFQIIGFFVQGNIDPFVAIAFVVSFLVAFVISLLVGLPFLTQRRR